MKLEIYLAQKNFSICVRWVDNNYAINEDMIAFTDVEQTDAATLTKNNQRCSCK